MEAVLGVLLGHEDELVDRPLELPELGVDLGQLEAGVEVAGGLLETRAQPLHRLVVALEDDQVVDRVLLRLLLPLAAAEPVDRQGLLPHNGRSRRDTREFSAPPPCRAASATRLRKDARDAWRGRDGREPGSL